MGGSLLAGVLSPRKRSRTVCHRIRPPRPMELTITPSEIIKRGKLAAVRVHCCQRRSAKTVTSRATRTALPKVFSRKTRISSLKTIILTSCLLDRQFRGSASVEPFWLAPQTQSKRSLRHGA
jgi:hypothetical protein